MGLNYILQHFGPPQGDMQVLFVDFGSVLSQKFSTQNSFNSLCQPQRVSG